MSVQTQRRQVPLLSHATRERYKRETAQMRAELAGDIVIPGGRGQDKQQVPVSQRRLKYMAQFNRPEVRPDAGPLGRRLRRMEAALANGTPGSLSRADKTRMEKEAETLKGWLQKKMVPQSHAGIGYGHKDFQKAVAQGVNECSPEFQRRAERFKSIMRGLAPDDPGAANLETIRPT